MNVDSFLARYQRFGVQLGLDRIERLLTAAGTPQARVPLVHVAGTNGKGSVCAYLAAILQAAGYRTGRHTSPHLIDWTERICVDGRAIAPETLLDTLRHIEQVIPPGEPPTQFELFTAAVWTHFARERVDVAVMEVGLGGRLDATNVKPDPLVSVIVSIARDHWQRLGSTLAAIAREKAGILKPGCPAVIGPLPPEAAAVVAARTRELACPTVWVEPATAIGGDRATSRGITYPLPLLGDVQLTNSAIAIATAQVLRERGWRIDDDAIATGMAAARWPGRLQWSAWQGREVLLDGAHNPAAAEALARYVATRPGPTTWVIGMLATKEHEPILRHLLEAGDRLFLAPVADHATADPSALAALAQTVCPDLAACQVADSLDDALARLLAIAPTGTTVLCGSLYLVGQFLALQERSPHPDSNASAAAN